MDSAALLDHAHEQVQRRHFGVFSVIGELLCTRHELPRVVGKSFEVNRALGIGHTVVFAPRMDEAQGRACASNLDLRGTQWFQVLRDGELVKRRSPSRHEPARLRSVVYEPNPAVRPR